MIEIIKGSFFAGEVKTFLIQGEYVEILECAYPIDVAMMDRSGAQLSTMRNAEASYFSRPGKYEVIQVTSASAQTVRLFVGSGDAGTRRTSGDVSVIDGEKNRTLAGGMFTGNPFNAVPVVDQYGVNQLWNPAASGKNLIVVASSVTGSSSQFHYAFGVAQVATDQTAIAVINKKGDGVAGVAKTGYGNFAAIEPKRLFGGGVTVNGLTNWPLRGALVVPPGYGLNCWDESVNHSIATNFEWFEEVI